MSRRVNDGDNTGIKQDKFRNSRFEHEENRDSSWYYGGVSKKTSNTLSGPSAENRGRRSADTIRSQWDGSPFENGKLYNWKQNYERRNGRYGDAQLFHDGGNFAGKGPRGYQRPDKNIYEDVCESLSLSPAIDASDIEVSVEKGIVYLKGSVSDRRTKKLAELEVENVSGVRDVQNFLTLKQDKKDLH